MSCRASAAIRYKVYACSPTCRRTTPRLKSVSRKTDACHTGEVRSSLIHWPQHSRAAAIIFDGFAATYFSFGATASSAASKSSCGESRFLLRWPHVSQRWVRIHTSPPLSKSSGCIMPPHSAARSPGLLSTCLLHKHFGQWFVYPLPCTKVPHRSQENCSTTRMNIMILL